MIYNKYYQHVIIRVILITVNSILLAFSITHIHDLLLILNLVLILGLQVYLLIRTMNKTNTNLAAFFSALENSDAMVSIQYRDYNRSYVRLIDQLNKVLARFNQLRIENEKQFYYLKAVVDHIGIGLIVCDMSGNVEILNDSGRKLLNMKQIKRLTDLNIYQDNLAFTLLNLGPGRQKMFRLSIAGQSLPIAFKVNDYRLSEKTVRILSFQNIKNELDSQELESWQKLIRVLTHEIMNSTGPISSSVDTVKEFLLNEKTGEIRDIKEIDQETIYDILNGIEIIKERSVGLAEFVRDFKSLTVNLQIVPKNFKATELFSHIRFLLTDEMKTRDIEFSIEVFPYNLEILADLKLIEQVVLNLVHNSMDAVNKIPEKRIRLKAFRNIHNQVLIQVIDNGQGIPADLIEKIFVPFFTTKEMGSGIGLSISRQIIQMHGGSISVKSDSLETCFEISFAE